MCDVLPCGWVERLTETGNVEKAYRTLTGDHFFVEAMKGRMASLLFEIEKADRHFNQAGQVGLGMNGQGDLKEDLRRAFILYNFHLENEILRNHISEKDTNRSIGEIVVRFDTSLVRLLARTLCLQGFICLHLDQDKRALTFFDDSLSHSARIESKGICYTGSACAWYNLHNATQFTRLMENAELAYSATDDMLNSTALASQIYTIYDATGNRMKAKSWLRTIGVKKIPKKVKKAFIRRSHMIVARSRNRNHLVLV